MVEQQKRRLESAISDMIEDMYRSHLRRMQVSSRHGEDLPRANETTILTATAHNASLCGQLLR